MSPKRPFVIGVTGGIGSGKTTVCREFQKLGAPMVDTDQVAREVVAPGTPGLAAVVAAFGPEVLTAEGQLDRRRVRQLVFATPELRVRLEAILHPLIRQATDAQVAAAGYPYCLVCIFFLVQFFFVAVLFPLVLQ
jgi:dephospho-CoA kinase